MYLQKRLAAAELAARSLHTQGPMVRSVLTARTPPARPRDRVPRGPRSHAMRRRARAAVAGLHQQLLDGPLSVVDLQQDEFCARDAAIARDARPVGVICERLRMRAHVW